jgi:hypothetical protein
VVDLTGFKNLSGLRATKVNRTYRPSIKEKSRKEQSIMKTETTKPTKKLTVTKTSIRVLTTTQQPAQKFPTWEC